MELKKVYAKKYNCPTEPWCLARGIEPDYIVDDNSGEDNYQIDREELTLKFENEYFKDIETDNTTSNKIDTLMGDIESKIKNTMGVLKTTENIILKGSYLEKNNHYIRVPYIVKNRNKITILFLQFKELNKFFKDWGTKASFMPNLFYTMDIAEHNLGNEFEIEYRLITLEDGTNDFAETFIYNNRKEDENIFAKEYEKNQPIYYNIESETEPEFHVGRDCKKCSYRKRHGIPNTSILELEVTSQCWRTTKKIIEKIGSLKIEDMGREEIDMLTDVQKNKLNAIQSESGKSINMKIINEFLDIIEDGYVSFDFEAYSSIIPPAKTKGYTNYAQIPFSYSLDIIDEWGAIEHRDYIVPYTKDNFDSLFKQLKKDMPTDKPIVVYFKTYEISRLKEFQERFPDDHDLIQNWIDNVIDLYEVFEKGGYYDLKFNNSCSLKNVYPVLVDSKDYELLDINNGEKAMIQYKLIFDGKISLNSDEKDRILNNLIEYNKKDTHAQIEIIDFLKKLGTK